MSSWTLSGALLKAMVWWEGRSEGEQMGGVWNHGNDKMEVDGRKTLGRQGDRVVGGICVARNGSPVCLCLYRLL